MTQNTTKSTNKPKRGSSFAKEFKEFIDRGNVLDLAVGVAVGGSFTAIVTSLVNDIIMPLVSLLAGGFDFTKLSLTIPNLFGDETAAVITYGNFIQNTVNFLLVALCVFLLVRTINRIRRPKPTTTKPKPNEQTLLLREIRDTLKKQK